jgi:hypothetical protein
VPALDLGAACRVDPPFPGLRPFEAHESHLFFGRESQAEDLLQRLSRNRLLAVVGTSGSGKSSLVRAGLLPDLHRGYLLGATSRWRIALLRPGRDPLKALAEALAAPEALGPDPSGRRELGLRATSYGLLDAVGTAALAPGEALLVVVDQFEELFRFERERGRGSDDTLFVSLLLEAAHGFRAPLYVVLTMRSDFLGDCARFDGLPEALNRGQYLVPRLTREQRQQAVEQPLGLAGASIEPGLVQLLLNDSGDDPDQLPLLRTYREWKRAGASGPLGFSHYEAAGRMGRALNDHAEELVASFASPDALRWVERLFRCLTTVDGTRMVRRPARLSRLLDVTGAPPDELKEIVERFAAPEHNLLVTSAGLLPESVVDISHESLIRKWGRLRAWVQHEAKSAEWYRDLVRDVERGAAPWRDPDLARVEALSEEDGWSEAWADQYSPGNPHAVQGVVAFLRASRRLVEEEAKREREKRQQEEDHRRRELEVAKQLARARLRARRWLSMTVALLVALLAAIGYFVRREVVKSREAAEKEKDWTRRFAEASEELIRAREQQKSLLKDRETTLVLLEASQDQGERRALEAQLDTLQRKYAESVAESQKVQGRLEAQRSLQETDSNQAVLGKQIADLQARLKEAQRQRDEAQRSLEAMATAEQRDAGYWKSRVQRLESELQVRGSHSPLLAVLPQRSYMQVTKPPFDSGGVGAETVGMALGDLGGSGASNAQVYLFVGKDVAGNETTFTNDSRRIRLLLAALSGRTGCPGISDDRRLHCFVANKQETISRTQRLGGFRYREQDYDVTSVAWTNAPLGGNDVITLLISPAVRRPLASAK